MNPPILSPEDYWRKLDSLRRPWHDNFLAMYSSVWGGLITDPVLMTLPADDHLVHRGDGVFDVFKCENGKAYCMKPHLQRLELSARGIDLPLPEQYAYIEDIIRAAVRAGGVGDVVVRIFISRGPGGFSADPTECPAGQLYVVVTRLAGPPPKAYANGVTVVSSIIPAKNPPFANIKSCNYLANVLTKKAAVEKGADYAVTWDHEGNLGESATENIFLVSPDRELLIPEFDRVLRGITITRIMALAEELVQDGRLKSIRNTRIGRDLAKSAPEVMICGTTNDVLPVTMWDGRPVGDGTPGPVARALLKLLRKDILENREYLTDLL